MAHINDSLTTRTQSSKQRKRGALSPQAKTRQNFLFASRYARAVIRNEDRGMAEAYATALRHKQNVYSRALEDCMSPPVVKNIDTRDYKGSVGDKIIIRAMDDFRVVCVILEIYDGSGALVETGNGVLNGNGIDYTYTVSKKNHILAGSKIVAIAIDIPGNEGMMEVRL